MHWDRFSSVACVAATVTWSCAACSAPVGIRPIANDAERVSYDGMLPRAANLQDHPMLDAVAFITPISAIDCDGSSEIPHKLFRYPAATQCWLRTTQTIEKSLNAELDNAWVKPSSLGLSTQLCTNDNPEWLDYLSWPVVSFGGATGFLVDEDSMRSISNHAANLIDARPHIESPLLLTAGHVIKEIGCSNTAVVFDFHKDNLDANNRYVIDPSSIAFCSSHLSVDRDYYDGRYEDGAIVELDVSKGFRERTRYHVSPLPELHTGDEVYAIGHAQSSIASYSSSTVPTNPEPGSPRIRLPIRGRPGASGAALARASDHAAFAIEVRGVSTTRRSLPSHMCFSSKDSSTTGCRFYSLHDEPHALRCGSETGPNETCFGPPWQDDGLALRIFGQLDNGATEIESAEFLLQAGNQLLQDAWPGMKPGTSALIYPTLHLPEQGSVV